MLRYCSRVKTSSLIPTRKLSVLTGMTEIDKIDSALATHYPNTAEIAYYQGLGFQKLGDEYRGHAIYSFRKAIQLDPDSLYARMSKPLLDKLLLDRSYNRNNL